MAHSTQEAPEGRILAIGDIHGCRDQLRSLIQQVNPTLQDQVVFLGDYIDRGPDSAGVIDDLIEFRENFPRTVYLRGNHEQMFLDYVKGNDALPFLMNGGNKTLESYEAKGWKPIPDRHLTFIESTRLHHSDADYIFVHAGLRPGVDLNGQDEQDLLWIREDFIISDYDWGKTIVYGHTPLAEPLLLSRRVGLDTGCVYGRQLTCCELKSQRIWQA